MRVDAAPEGTIWFGGSFDHSQVSLRIFGDDLDPGEISNILGVASTHSERKGEVIIENVTKNKRTATTGRWSISSNLPSETDVEDKPSELLDQVSNGEAVWDLINKKYKVDIFCGMFMEAENREFSLSVKILKN